MFWGRVVNAASGHSLFIWDSNAVGPIFLAERFPVPQESKQDLLISERRVQLWQGDDSPIAVGCFYEQTIGEPFARHGFSKADTSPFQHAFERNTFKIYGSRGMFGRCDLDVRQSFKVCAAQTYWFPRNRSARSTADIGGPCCRRQVRTVMLRISRVFSSHTRRIMTSVALIRAAAVCPRFSFISRAELAVMIEVIR